MVLSNSIHDFSAHGSLRPVARATSALCARLQVAVMLMLLTAFPATAQTPTRVISTDAAITDIVLSLEQGRRLVAVDVTSTLPPQHEGLPRVGYHRGLSPEGLLSLRPELVLASEHAGPAAALVAVRAAGVQVLQLPSPRSVEELARNVEQIALTLGAGSQGKTLAAKLRSQRHTLRQSPARGQRALLLRDADGELRAAGSGTAGAAYLELLGAENLADHEGYRSYTQEAVLALRPQLLLIAVAGDLTPAALLERFPLLRFSAAAAQESLLPLHSQALVGGISLRALDSAVDLAPRLAAQEPGQAPRAAWLQ